MVFAGPDILWRNGPEIDSVMGYSRKEDDAAKAEVVSGPNTALHT